MSLQLRHTYTADEILSDLTILLHLGEQMVEVDDTPEPADVPRSYRLNVISAIVLFSVFSIGLGFIATYGPV